ncbi:Hypothetical protein A7982_10413 [Minicystis rosea]|nr:Hypothetical protein A7982_10413 [Minicystis rosea]
MPRDVLMIQIRYLKKKDDSMFGASMSPLDGDYSRSTSTV